jgi:pimeloyl-ACP methyl ester carboxylesterase
LSVTIRQSARDSLLVLLVCAATPCFGQTGVGPPLGKLVDIGGRRLHIHCTGSGSPTVVIEAGASSFAIDFAVVQPAVAKTTRVCSYDRAGSGWSDARENMETPARIVRDLQSLLKAAGEKPPYVMVGASRGGLLVRLFQSERPADVVGLVLIDPAFEDRLFTMFQGKAVAIASLTAEQYRSLTPPAAVPVPKRPPQTGPPFDRLPKTLYDTRVALDRQLIDSMPPTLAAALVAEHNEGERAALAQLKSAREASPFSLGELPLVVLSRGRDASPELHAAHAELSRISRNAHHRVVGDAYHEIHLSHPDVVVAAVREVLSAVRDRRPLRPPAGPVTRVPTK